MLLVPWIDLWLNVYLNIYNVWCVLLSTEEVCEPCQHRNITVTATKYCNVCEEKYCESCTLSHMAKKLTKMHKIVDITKDFIDKKLCEPCDSKNKGINATYICDDCDENLCEACKKFHMLLKRNKNHKIRSLVQQLFCETCSAQVTL